MTSAVHATTSTTAATTSSGGSEGSKGKRGRKPGQKSSKPDMKNKLVKSLEIRLIDLLNKSEYDLNDFLNK